MVLWTLAEVLVRTLTPMPGLPAVLPCAGLVRTAALLVSTLEVLHAAMLRLLAEWLRKLVRTCARVITPKPGLRLLLAAPREEE